MREIWIVAIICIACALSYWADSAASIAKERIRFERDKAHQELVVEKIREERLLLEARIRELEITGSFITKEGLVYDQSIDPVN